MKGILRRWIFRKIGELDDTLEDLHLLWFWRQINARAISYLATYDCVYCISTFLLPTSLLLSVSWWREWSTQSSGGTNRGKISLVVSSMTKEFCGMNFWQFYGFNLVMLGKHKWKFTTDQEFSHMCFQSQIFPNKELSEIHLGHNLCFVWHNIHTLRVIVQSDLRWKLGHKRNTNV